MESIISTFHIDWKIIIAQAVNFGIVFFVLYVYALKPLSKLMSERSEKIQKGMNDAKENEKLLAETSKKYEEILSQAKMESQKIFETGKKEGEAVKNKIVEDAKKESQRIIESTKKTLEAEKSQLVMQAKKEIVEVAMLATEKLLGSKHHGAYDEKVIKEISHL